MNLTWKEFLRETREDLGITRLEFSRLLGVSLSTFNSWEYSQRVPPPIYQDMIVRLHDNSDEIRAMLDADRARYLKMGYSDAQPGQRGNGDFWKGVKGGITAVGAVVLLMGLNSKFRE